MLPMSTRYVVKCEVTPPLGPLGNSRRCLGGSIPVGGGVRLGVLEGHCYPHAHWTDCGKSRPHQRCAA